MACFGATGARVFAELAICSDPDRSDCTAASVTMKIKILALRLEPALPSKVTTVGVFHWSEVSRHDAVPGRRRRVPAGISTTHCARFSTASGTAVGELRDSSLSSWVVRLSAAPSSSALVDCALATMLTRHNAMAAVYRSNSVHVPPIFNSSAIRERGCHGICDFDACKPCPEPEPELYNFEKKYEVP